MNAGVSGSKRGFQAWQRKWIPFGWGNVTKLALVYFCSTLYFYGPIGTLYLLSKDLNYVQINSLWGIIVGTMFLSEVPTGMLADRLGRKRSISVALALQVIGEVVYIFANSYALFVLTSIVAGLGFAFASGCVDALVYDSLRARGREGEMSKAMGLIDAAQRTANLIAYAAGGLLVVQLTQERFTLAIAATACAVGVGWLLTFTLEETKVERKEPSGDSPFKLLADGIQTLRCNKPFRRLVLLALVTIPFRDYLAMYQARLVDVGLTPIWLGFATALASGLSILGARYAYRLDRRLGTRTSLLLVTGLPGILYLLAAAAAHPALSVLAYCTLSGSMSLKGPLFAGYLNRHIESRNRATVLSLISAFSGLYVALMGLPIGRVGDVSLTYAFVFMGLIVLAGSLLFRAGGATEMAY